MLNGAKRQTNGSHATSALAKNNAFVDRSLESCDRLHSIAMGFAREELSGRRPLSSVCGKPAPLLLAVRGVSFWTEARRDSVRRFFEPRRHGEHREKSQSSKVVSHRSVLCGLCVSVVEIETC